MSKEPQVNELVKRLQTEVKHHSPDIDFNTGFRVAKQQAIAIVREASPLPTHTDRQGAVESMLLRCAKLIKTNGIGNQLFNLELDTLVAHLGDVEHIAPLSSQGDAGNVLNYIKMRLVQIASGDYKACGHSAEDVARDALAALSPSAGIGQGNIAIEENP